MSRLRALLALLLAALLLVVPGAAGIAKPTSVQTEESDFASAPVTGDGERILSFVSDVVVAADATLTVTETIRLRAEGREIRHGPYRDFPTRYERDGRRVRVGFDVLSVARDGQAEPYHTESISNGVRVYIGDANRDVPEGEHTYVLRYTTDHQIGFFAAYDELYWNVTGNGWAFPIDMAETRIHLPQPVQLGQRAFYTGPQGATSTNAEVVDESPGNITFRTTQGLNAYEGMTVAVAWPKGIVQAPPPPSAASLWLERFAPLWAALIMVVALCLFYFQAWRKAGRGPLPGTIVPLFAPPDGMSAAGVRYVRRMGFDNRVFAAAIVESGVKGKIRLEEEKGGFLSRGTTTIHKTAEPDGMAAPEAAMLRALFSWRDRVEMKKQNHTTFSAARKGLTDGLEAAYYGRYFLGNKGWAWAGLVLIAAAMLAVALVMFLTDSFLDPFDAAVPLLGLAALGGALALGRGSRLASPEGSLLRAGLAIALDSVGLLLLVVAIGMAAEQTNILPMLAPLLPLPLGLSAFSWMAAPTREGRTVMDEIDGFKKYLSVTEESRLDTLHPPEKTPELFERYLPYAIALGVENRWADRFQSVLAAAAQQPGQTHQMGWYSGSHNAWSSPGRFAAAVGGALASSVAAASTAPGSSSGSGGGGSSGGGGGGGGGGGW